MNEKFQELLQELAELHGFISGGWRKPDYRHAEQALASLATIYANRLKRIEDLEAEIKRLTKQALTDDETANGRGDQELRRHEGEDSQPGRGRSSGVRSDRQDHRSEPEGRTGDNANREDTRRVVRSGIRVRRSASPTVAGGDTGRTNGEDPADNEPNEGAPQPRNDSGESEEGRTAGGGAQGGEGSGSQ